MPYGVQLLHSTWLSSPLIGLEPSSVRVNRDFRHGWLEMLGRVTPHQANVCTSFTLIKEFKDSFLRKGTFNLFVQWALAVYSWKTSQKPFVWKQQGKQTPWVCRCHMGSWKGIRGTCKQLLAGLKWEVGSCVKEQSDAVSLTASAKFLNNRNKGGEISRALTWSAIAVFIISSNNAQDIQLINHSRLCDLHNIYRNLLGCNLLQLTNNAKHYSHI